MRRRTVIMIALLVPAGAIGFVAKFSWIKPPSYPTSSEKLWRGEFPDESDVKKRMDTAPAPLVLSASYGKGVITIVGVHHTRDPKDPQIVALETEWAKAKPTVAFVEGKASGPLSGLNTISKHGEAGWLVAKARASGARYFTWDVPREALVAEIRKHFTAEQTALAIIGNKYFSDFRFGKPSDPDGMLAGLIAERGGYPELEGKVQSVADYDRLWIELLPRAKDWRDTSDEYGLPGFIEDIALHTRRMRDSHLLNMAVQEAEKGGRVFAVAGHTHAVRLEPIFREWSGNR